MAEPTSSTLRWQGRRATIESIEQDFEDRVYLAVTVDDDPGRDLGLLRQPGHRFFFSPEEVEPLGASGATATTMAAERILIAGIGNIFLGDDAFGVEVAQRMVGRPLPEGVQVIDFGIRGFDLAFALMDGWDATIMVDALSRGEPPGTLYRDRA